VDVMDGEIGVSSKPGKGSQFWFRVPLLKKTPARSTPPRGAAKARCVWIAHESPRLRESIRSSLTAPHVKFRELKLRPNPERPVIDKLIDYQEFCGVGGTAPGQEEAGAVESISVTELKKLLDGDTTELVLIDVRNPPEAAIAVIPGAELIPLDQIESGTAIDRVRELAAGKTLYAHCKLGGRSAKALIALKRHGIEGINVAGGIDAWSQDVDPSVPRY